ncbi:hypothetical protein WA158_007783 [Blastocystis sp. Blastoise]
MEGDIIFNGDLLSVVDTWAKGKEENNKEIEVQFEKRPARLGLGAKYVPHKKEEHKIAGTKLLKKIKKDNSKMKSKYLDAHIDESESDEDLSKAQAISEKKNPNRSSLKSSSKQKKSKSKKN